MQHACMQVGGCHLECPQPWSPMSLDKPMIALLDSYIIVLLLRQGASVMG